MNNGLRAGQVGISNNNTNVFSTNPNASNSPFFGSSTSQTRQSPTNRLIGQNTNQTGTNFTSKESPFTLGPGQNSSMFKGSSSQINNIFASHNNAINATNTTNATSGTNSPQNLFNPVQKSSSTGLWQNTTTPQNTVTIPPQNTIFPFQTNTQSIPQQQQPINLPWTNNMKQLLTNNI